VGSLLLDTHALYWYEAGAPQLSSRALGVMRTGASPLTVSATSIWEGHRRRGVAVVSQRRDASCSLIAAVRRRVRGPHRQRRTSGGLLPLKLGLDSLAREFPAVVDASAKADPRWPPSRRP
jgi:hypothetical protein